MRKSIVPLSLLVFAMFSAAGVSFAELYAPSSSFVGCGAYCDDSHPCQSAKCPFCVAGDLPGRCSETFLPQAARSGNPSAYPAR